MKLTFKDIEEKGLLLYKYIRGSHVYGTNIETSDVDEGGVYIAPTEQLLDLGYEYQDEISDEKHDTCWWELGKFMRLILSSNPTVLESLFIPEDKVIYEHPIITEIKKHRNEFITKQCFKPFGGYAVSQIKKARGQDKKIHWDIEQMTRKTPLDFTYTFAKQGSQSILDWLDERGLDQRNIGLVNIPNMQGVYGAYYDFGQHFKLENITREWFCDVANKTNKFTKYCFQQLGDWWIKENQSYGAVMEDIWERHCTPKGKHCGIVSINGDSDEIRYSSHVTFSSVTKGDKPICWIYYNQNNYENHCRKFKEYEEWKKNRNKARYENNLEGLEKENVAKFYDAKNMGHCFRLIAMATEIAEGKGLNICRTGIDADFLIDVRNRKYTYDELMSKLETKKAEMDAAIETANLKESIDKEFVNKLLLDARQEFFKK